jgi:hypothetical protein
MPMSRQELDRMLGVLEQRMPALAGAAFDDATFWPIFWRLARPIEEFAGPGERDYIRNRFSEILGRYGLITCDHTGRPLDARAA